MGEAMMFRYPGDSGGSSGNVLITQIFKENGNFTVPKGVKQVDVRIFGGGGGGASTASTLQNHFASAGGGGGWMNNAIINVTPGEVIPITIGAGGLGNHVYKNNASVIAGTGGITSFGTYLSAAGGGGGNITWVKKGSYNYDKIVIAGSGGSGGGVSYTVLEFNNSNMTGYPSGYIKAGDGYQFGGGGAIKESYNKSIANGGSNGGIWGGGGGVGEVYNNTRNGGYGGTYGGNGHWYYQQAENGTNTIGNTDIPESLRGYGVAGYNEYTGVSHGHGGGGYGGNGGTAAIVAGGGGGGYGADGGDAPYQGTAGGGGGYGKNGYGGEGSIFGAGGGGAYGSGGAATSVAHDGGGGCGIHNNNSFKKCGNGASGICIIQYYL